MKSFIAFCTVVIVVLLLWFLTGCTDQYQAKQMGGTATIDLPAGVKLVNVTWKEDNLWYLYRPMTPSDSAQTYVFRESSSLGIMEGTVIIKEHRDH